MAIDSILKEVKTEPEEAYSKLAPPPKPPPRPTPTRAGAGAAAAPLAAAPSRCRSTRGTGIAAWRYDLAASR